MSRYFIHLAYRGSRYRGWQWQPDIKNTVQGVLEDTFEKLLKR
ncbi:MAG: tRNA pseudouridine38-40 synthase, partial [Planctomycetota bacterium]